MKTRSRIGFSILLDFLIDFALIGLGYLIYYNFYISTIPLFAINPIVTQLMGSKLMMVAVIAGIPFIVGLFNLARTVHRILIALKEPFSKK